MAIKEVKEIPRNNEKMSQKDRICADIKNALENGIYKFEFVGDEYNYKHLCPYAKQVVDEMLARELRTRLKKEQKERGWISPILVYRPQLNEPHYIRISQMRCKDRNHVYCEIVPNNLEWIIQRSIEEEEEKRRRNASYGE